MPVSDSFKEYVLEQLRQVQPVRAKRMFGGVGIWALETDLFFAVMGDDVLYFKVDDSNRADYTTRNMAQFMTMQYYAVPGEVLDDADVLAVWMEKALAVAAKKGRK